MAVPWRAPGRRVVSGLFRGGDAGNIHGLNEHISLQSVLDGREFMYRLIGLRRTEVAGWRAQRFWYGWKT
jgi:hypothetical protein